jgi:hypothetical protein
LSGWLLNPLESPNFAWRTHNLFMGEDKRRVLACQGDIDRPGKSARLTFMWTLSRGTSSMNDPGESPEQYKGLTSIKTYITERT